MGERRILALLAGRGIPATFFMPAVSALLHPGELRRYLAEGHEVGMHGWIHERTTTLAPADERELALRSADVLENTTGARPVGIRTPSWDFTPATLGIIRELGLSYDSSLMADDDPYEILQDGEPSGIVEIPVEWIRDDAVYFPMERYSALRPYASPRSVLTIWIDEFEGAYADRGLFQLTMHPHVIGHRSRLVVLTELLDHIASRQGVWFATHAQVAQYALAHAAGHLGLPVQVAVDRPGDGVDRGDPVAECRVVVREDHDAVATAPAGEAADAVHVPAMGGVGQPAVLHVHGEPGWRARRGTPPLGADDLCHQPERVAA